MPGFPELLAQLPIAAASWQGVTVFALAAVVWVFVSLRVARNKNLLNRLQSLPANERADVLKAEMGGTYLAKGMSAQQFLKHQTNGYLLVAFLATLGALVVVFVVAIQAVANANARNPAPDDPGRGPGAHSGDAPAAVSAEDPVAVLSRKLEQGNPQAECRFVIIEPSFATSNKKPFLNTLTVDGVPIVYEINKPGILTLRRFNQGRYRVSMHMEPSFIGTEADGHMELTARLYYSYTNYNSNYHQGDDPLIFNPTDENSVLRHLMRYDLDAPICAQSPIGVSWQFKSGLAPAS